MGKINLLSFEVANLIAAGEVVDRPASAVKELLENAIDSGATQITLEIQRGGVTFIRVADNGCGIEKDDLRPAITRHSTSKIKTAADLDRILTLGFRGEALAAIASVSRLRIFSKVPGTTLGAVLEAEGGRVTNVSDTGCQEGTTVIVEDLFYNVPARRKFLKKDSTEAIAIGAVIEKIALSHPEISFKFLSDGEVKFVTSGKGDLKETIWALLGKDTARRSLPVDREEGGIRVSGFTSEADMIRSNRNMENFFINGRYIKSKTASAALEGAYASKIPQDKFPFCVLNIELNPAAVDVNVHPAKLEVKFADEKKIFDAVYYAVLSALEAEANRPELQLPQNPPASSTYAKAFLPLDQKKKGKQLRMDDRSAGEPDVESGKPAESPENAVEAHRRAEENLRKAADFTPSYITDAPAVEVPPDFGIPTPTDDDAPLLKLSEPEETPAEAASRLFGNELSAVPAMPAAAPKTPAAPATAAMNSDERTSPPEVRTESTKPQEPPKPSVSPEDPYAAYDEAIRPADVPEYFILGEAFKCYVIVQLEDRLLMIDKHAAHERILFDELCRKMRTHLREKKAGDGQLLLAPLELELLTTEADVMNDYREKIRALGFDFTFEKTGVSSHKAVITQIPDELDRNAAAELFMTLSSKLSDASASVESAAEGFFESRLWQASCKAAIKGGRLYDMGHIKWICDRLLKKPGPDNSVIRTCPHGRPVAFEIKKSSIDRQFARLT